LVEDFPEVFNLDFCRQWRCVLATDPEGIPPSGFFPKTDPGAFSAVRQSLSGHPDFTIVFGQQPEFLIAAFHHHRADDF
jgi:hypothetical protein